MNVDLPPEEQTESTEWLDSKVRADVHRDGAVAAPTAALHVTPELMVALAARGIAHETLTLNAARAAGHRLIAVGTASLLLPAR